MLAVQRTGLTCLDLRFYASCSLRYQVAPQYKPLIIDAGPDGALWFARSGDGRTATRR